MQGCSCQLVLTAPRHTRGCIRSDPFAHLHAGEVNRLCTRVYSLVYDGITAPVYARDEWYSIYKCGDLYVGAPRIAGDRSMVFRTCPVGIPMWVNAYNMLTETGTTLHVRTDTLRLMRVTPCNIATWAARVLVSEHVRKQVRDRATDDAYVRAVRTRTGAYMSLYDIRVSASAFVDLAGVMPPIRHEFGGANVTMTSRYAVTYTSRRRRLQRTRASVYTWVIQWYIPLRRVCRLRLHRGFAVNHRGHITIDGRTVFGSGYP